MSQWATLTCAKIKFEVALSKSTWFIQIDLMFFVNIFSNKLHWFFQHHFHLSMVLLRGSASAFVAPSNVLNHYSKKLSNPSNVAVPFAVWAEYEYDQVSPSDKIVAVAKRDGS